MSKKLVVFTIEFPDPFLNGELPYLLSVFDSVFVVTPVVKNATQYERVSVHQINSRYQSANSVTLLRKHFLRVLRIYLYSMFSIRDFLYYIRYYRSYLGYLLKELELEQPVAEFIQKHNLGDAVFYDFWLVDATITLAELKKKGLIKKSVARAHGFDLYDERQFEKRLSFRNYRIKYLNAVFVISKQGSGYLKARVKKAFKSKIQVSYLGVESAPQTNVVGKIDKEFFTIVSCARLVPLKRIHLIAEILRTIEVPIRWIHFGDGLEKERVFSIAREFPSHVEFDFKGNTSNQQIMNFYAAHYIDLFVSVSESEGLPVSMMEAISFGIPIFACSVNGIPEIAIDATGVTVPVTTSIDQLRMELVNTLRNKKFDRNKIRSFYEEHFSASKNYKLFAERLAKLN